ncbi:hypothetical protein FN846DRAFT_1020028 [Sphaerosporella brunnea]|uniref:Uncharacterized protein n=1 Tax=Sphaerosporella brunnea TaxID=1250544 RepID=A0A5J5F3F5_9PEZI|nr:hypothetical protein FN846DRAFT_1020028 [Sphaerosporella brunnea]
MTSESGTSTQDPSSLAAAKHQVNNHTYTLNNIGRALLPGETLLDVAYAKIKQWRELETGFTTIKYPITFARLKERTKRTGHPSKDFPNANPVKFKFLPSSLGTVVLLDGHKKKLGFRCVIPKELIAQLEETEHILPAKKAKECRCGKYVSRHYVLWGDCMKKVQPSKEYRKDYPH